MVGFRGSDTAQLLFCKDFFQNVGVELGFGVRFLVTAKFDFKRFYFVDGRDIKLAILGAPCVK